MFVFAGLMAPLLLKNAVEAVTASKIGVAVQALLVAGLYRLISGIAKEAQTPIFTPIAQVHLGPGILYSEITDDISAFL